jgi:Fe-S cluster biogenesis protein NfuA
VVVGQVIDQVQGVIEEVLKPRLHDLGGEIELLGVSADGEVRVSIKGRYGACPTSQAAVEDMVAETIKEKAPGVRRVAINVQAVSDELVQEGLRILRGGRPDSR